MKAIPWVSEEVSQEPSKTKPSDHPMLKPFNNYEDDEFDERDPTLRLDLSTLEVHYHEAGGVAGILSQPCFFEKQFQDFAWRDISLILGSAGTHLGTS